MDVCVSGKSVRCQYEEGQLIRFLENMVFGRFSNLSYCMHFPGDTVVFPARTAHMVFSVSTENQWHVLLSHNIRHSEAKALELEIKCSNLVKAPEKRLLVVNPGVRTGKKKKRFTARKRKGPRN